MTRPSAVPLFARTLSGAWALAAALLGVATLAAPVQAQPSPPVSAASAARAALTVTAVQPQNSSVPTLLAVHGNIAAWQEAIVGSEAGGLRLAEVKADVGDRVKRGQVLARYADDTVRAELAQIEAALAEAEASAADAAGNAQRVRTLQDSGALSAQQIQQYLTGEQTARARMAAQRAALQAQRLRLKQAQVLAPDDGVISARTATVGAVVGAGQELFRLIRGGRLEWRAEVPAAELARLKAGQPAVLTTPSGRQVAGTVRQLAPTVDPQTRNGLVYVDLKPGPDSDARAGMFARGEFRFDPRPALTLPASALLLRDGYQVVMRVEADQRVRETKVRVVGRDGDRIAIEGLPADARVVSRGAAFLTDGDTVRVVADEAPAAPAAPTAPAKS